MDDPRFERLGSVETEHYESITVNTPICEVCFDAVLYSPHPPTRSSSPFLFKDGDHCEDLRSVYGRPAPTLHAVRISCDGVLTHGPAHNQPRSVRSSCFVFFVIPV